MTNAVPSVKKLHNCSKAIETSIKIKYILTFRDQMVALDSRFVSGFSFINRSAMLECLLVCSRYNMASRLRGLSKFLIFRPSSFCFSSLRPIHTGSMNLGNLEKEFQVASERSKTLKQDPGNEHKLKLYALFKQVSFSCTLFIYTKLSYS